MATRKKMPAISRAARRRAAVAVMNAIKPVEARYVRSLRGVMRAVAREYMRVIEPRLSDIARTDGATKPISSVIAGVDVEVAASIARTVGPLFDRMARDVKKANAKGQALLGIKLGTFTGQSGIVTNTELGIFRDIEAAKQRNILLVENAHRVYAKQVRELVEDPGTFGVRVEVLKARLLERADVSESRAELIARDQTLKLNGQITATRQQRAGVEEYVWSTSQDDRVRETHAELEGQRFSWLAPPEPGHPGQDFQCRCVAIPVGIDELDEVFG